MLSRSVCDVKLEIKKVILVFSIARKMNVSAYFLAFVCFSLGLINLTKGAEDACIKKTACSCEFSNGTGIDISESAKTTFFTTQSYELRENATQYWLTTYYFHPCFDVLPNVNSSVPGNTCNQPLTVCRHTNRMVSKPNATGEYSYVEGNYEFMGSSNVTQFLTDDNGVSIFYYNGPSSSLVLLVCAETDDNLEVQSTEDPHKIALAFYTRNACLRQMSGRSTGSTLLIIFFSCVIFYLVLGVLTKKFLMGATGIEVVPNLAFWSDLPNLVKDGWAFAINGFKLPARGTGPAVSPDPNSYDSI